MTQRKADIGRARSGKHVNPCSGGVQRGGRLDRPVAKACIESRSEWIRGKLAMAVATSSSSSRGRDSPVRRRLLIASMVRVAWAARQRGNRR